MVRLLSIPGASAENSGTTYFTGSATTQNKALCKTPRWLPRPGQRTGVAVTGEQREHGWKTSSCWLGRVNPNKDRLTVET